MNRERELLQLALEALAYHRDAGDCGCEELIVEINTELAKPEPVDCGWVSIVNGVLTNCWNNPDLPEGTHKILAVRIDDEQEI